MPAEIYERLKARFGESAGELDDTVKSPFIKIGRAEFFEIMWFLRDDPDLRFDFLQLITGIDYPVNFTVVYHLYSYAMRHAIAVKAELPRDNPTIRSVAELWPAADWHERETFDLMGIIFEGHPNLRRILLPEDWEGHPLRKDYVQPEEYHGISNTRRIGDTAYPRPDEDARAILQYKPPPPQPKPAA